MNAVNPLPPSQRQYDRAPDRQAEPSMEEILASIRRIIADDQALPEPVAAPQPNAAPPSRGIPRERVVETAQREESSNLAAYGQVTAPQFPTPAGPPSGGPAAADGQADEEPAGDDGSPARERLVGQLESFDRSAMSAPAAWGGADPSTGPQQEHPVRNQLARDLSAGTDPVGRSLAGDPVASGGSLISDATDKSLSSAFNMLAATRLTDNSEELRSMARELIRPLLKSWLDDNLPNLVERLVRAEIERVARGGR